MSKEKKYYQIKYTCSNCWSDFYQDFEYGQVAHQGTCPACGVSPSQLERDEWIHKMKKVGVKDYV